MQTKQELSIPLIGTLLQESEREVNESVADETIEGVILSLLLSAMLFLQFNMAIVHDEADLGFTMVNCSIALFTVTHFLFQKTLEDAKIFSTIALLPEFVALGASAFVFFQYPTLGFLIPDLGHAPDESHRCLDVPPLASCNGATLDDTVQTDDGSRHSRRLRKHPSTESNNWDYFYRKFFALLRLQKHSYCERVCILTK